MPTAKVRTTARVNPGDLRSIRPVNARSWIAMPIIARKWRYDLRKWISFKQTLPATNERIDKAKGAAGDDDGDDAELPAEHRDQGGEAERDREPGEGGLRGR